LFNLIKMKSPGKTSLPSQIKLYADQVSTNADILSTYLETQNGESSHVDAPELAVAQMKLAEAAFELFNLSQDTGSFLTHLTVDVCWHLQNYWFREKMLTKLTVPCHLRVEMALPLQYSSPCSALWHGHPRETGRGSRCS
jgi:hypothetical protein